MVFETPSDPGVLVGALGRVTFGVESEIADALAEGRAFHLDRQDVIRIVMRVYAKLSAEAALDGPRRPTRTTYLPGMRRAGPRDPGNRVRRIVQLRPVMIPREEETVRIYASAPRFKIRTILSLGALDVVADLGITHDGPLTAVAKEIMTDDRPGDILIDADSLQVAVITVEGTLAGLEVQLGDLCGQRDLDALASGPHWVQIDPEAGTTAIAAFAHALGETFGSLAERIRTGTPLTLTAQDVVDVLIALCRKTVEGQGAVSTHLPPVEILGPVAPGAETESAGRSARRMTIWLAVLDGKPAGRNQVFQISRGNLAGLAMTTAERLTYGLMRSRPDLLEAYHGGPLTDTPQSLDEPPKRVVRARSPRHLEEIENEARIAGVPFVNMTSIWVPCEPGGQQIESDGQRIRTCVAFGPAYEDELPPPLRDLPLLDDRT